MNRAAAVPLLALLALCACRQQDMYGQQKAFFWGTFDYFRNGREMQAPPEGTVARNSPDQAVPQPSVITADMLAEGQIQYNVNCAPCHDQTGDAEGMIVGRGFPKPPELFSKQILNKPAKEIYKVIQDGHGVMYSYATRVEPAQRWAIIAYIRALQLSQHAQVASLPARDQAALRKVLQ